LNFCQIWISSPPCTNVKPARTNVKPPLLTTFWRRLWLNCTCSKLRDESVLYKHYYHGRPQGGGEGQMPPLEIGTKKQKFLENVKSAFWFCDQLG